MTKIIVTSLRETTLKIYFLYHYKSSNSKIYMFNYGLDLQKYLFLHFKKQAKYASKRTKPIIGLSVKQSYS